MKILFLPFLKISTGHHAVAEALIRSLEKRIYNIDCKKIDIFSYTDKLLEKAFRVTYLKWIDHSPETFEWIYRNFVYPSNSTKHLNLYEKKFLVKMKNLIENEQPNLIVCTQAFPSFLISRLRYKRIYRFFYKQPLGYPRYRLPFRSRFLHKKATRKQI